MSNNRMAVDAAAFHRDGFVVVENVFDAAALDRMRAEGVAICRGQRGPARNLEPAAPELSDAEAMRRYIVCGLAHKASPVLRDFMVDRRLAEVLTQLIGPGVKGFHSQFYFKHASTPGNAWHQDETFNPTRDRSMVTAWIAVEDATIENGCLRFLPGSHRPSVLWPMHPHNNPELDRAEEAFGFPYKDADAVACPVRAGSIVFFSGYVLHSSFPNRTVDGFRRALLFVYCSTETPVMFDPVTYQPLAMTDYRDIELVAGTDYYAWKGVSSVGQPYMRSQPKTEVDAALAAKRREVDPVRG